MIAVISYNIHSNHMNYGAALHTYAFQTFLKNKGKESIIINYYPQALEGYNLKYPILNTFQLPSLKNKIWNIINWGLGALYNIKKYRKFKEFFQKHFRCTQKQYSHFELLNTPTIEDIDFDTFICESDVIWKLYNKGGFDDVFFLNIPAAKSCKKIAYSPSLGSRIFDSEESKKFLHLVKDFHAISTREKQGAIYLTELLKQKVDWVLDPTLLLNAQDYSPIALKPKEERYLLVYNCMTNDKEMITEAAKLASRLNLKLIEISNFFINSLTFKHTVKTDVGIEEFLGYFKYADFIVCNAFHGCCFANIFQRQFFLFQRDHSDYRMKNITDALGESSRLISCDNKIIPSVFEEIDYKIVAERLSALREKSVNFIISALES